MDVSELRKRIMRALDDARKDAVERRRVVDEASRAYEQFLANIAVPLMRQTAIVLRAEGQEFTVHAPAESVRLASNNSAQSFIEFELDVSAQPPQVIGRTSVPRGRQAMVVEERPLAPGKPIADLDEDDVTKFLVNEIPRLVMRP